MKIAFVGKGGSGKTTLSALWARWLAGQGRPVLAIDADINQHLADTLGMTAAEAKELPALGSHLQQIKAYLKGSNPLIGNVSEMIKTTPAGCGSRLLSLDDDLFKNYGRTVNGVLVLAVGAFEEADLGVKCYHSKTGAVELVLNHLIEGPKDYVVVDMTAGSDAFASGLFTRFDVTFLVVEPTLKSISVYRQYKQYAQTEDIFLRVIGNKAQDQADRDFIAQATGSDLVACLGSIRLRPSARAGPGDRTRPAGAGQPGGFG